jgi:hypothetical protein
MNRDLRASNHKNLGVRVASPAHLDNVSDQSGIEAAKSVASFVFGLSCEALALAIAWWDAPPGHLVGFSTLALWGGTCVN